jgi:excisionase family DNA binding protein
MENQPLLLSMEQAATLLGLSKTQIYELCRSRSRAAQAIPIPTVRVGRRLMFRKESLQSWIQQLETR